MRAAINVKDFRRITTIAARVCESRCTIPILSMLRLNVGADGRLTVTGTNLDVEATATAPTIAHEAGAICVPGRLRALLATLPNWECISIRVAEDNRVVIDMPDGRASFIGATVDDFPAIGGSIEFDKHFDLDCRALRHSLEIAAPFMSSELTRYYLNGVMMQAPAGTLQFVATDGHKLICHDAAASDVTLPPRIVPGETIRHLLKILPRDGSVSMSFNSAGTRVAFRMSDGDVELHSKLIDGTFPDFTRVIPNDDLIKSRYELNRSSVLGAIRRLGCLVQRGARQLDLCEETDGRLALSRTDRDFGAYVCAVAGSRIDGKTPIAVTVDLWNLLTVMRPHNEAMVHVAFIDAGSPMAVKTPGTLAIVMPMRGDLERRMALPDGAVA